MGKPNPIYQTFRAPRSSLNTGHVEEFFNDSLNLNKTFCCSLTCETMPYLPPLRKERMSRFNEISVEKVNDSSFHEVFKEFQENGNV